MAAIENRVESHHTIMADIARNHAILEELLGRQLPPLPQPNDPPVPLEKIMADIAMREERLQKMLKNQQQHPRKHDILPAKQDNHMERHDKTLAAIHRLQEENRRRLDSITRRMDLPDEDADSRS